jgi:hypothetical protein
MTGEDENLSGRALHQHLFAVPSFGRGISGNEGNWEGLRSQLSASLLDETGHPGPDDRTRHNWLLSWVQGDVGRKGSYSAELGREAS